MRQAKKGMKKGYAWHPILDEMVKKAGYGSLFEVNTNRGIY